MEECEDEKKVLGQVCVNNAQAIIGCGSCRRSCLPFRLSVTRSKPSSSVFSVTSMCSTTPAEQAHGFEIQMEGIHAADIYRIFGAGAPFGYPGNVIRYGQGTAVDYATGVYVRWMSPWDPVTQSFTLATPIPAAGATVPGDSCWRIGMPQTYETFGCEHFGISSYKQPTQVIYRWLVTDPQTPGNLMYATHAVSIPAPTWTVQPPAQVGGGPNVVAEVQAPNPPQPELQFGDAQWVKVYENRNRPGSTTGRTLWR